MDGVDGEILIAALEALAPGGNVTTLGYAASTKSTIDVTNLIWKGASLKSFLLFNNQPSAWTEAWEAIVNLLKSGQINPIVAKSFPLEHAAEAIRCQVEGRPFGRVIITI
ncbi:zinc-binding dehydrogenase [Dyella humicola]|uniref:zinc-binding dehydrogenase n=1 Tax=Dyella humicola TaxID=2992126 RepID=UPI00224F17BC|nr:zinc-binding dehydrogenase [Dyella humicola]